MDDPQISREDRLRIAESSAQQLVDESRHQGQLMLVEARTRAAEIRGAYLEGAEAIAEHVWQFDADLTAACESHGVHSVSRPSLAPLEAAAIELATWPEGMVGPPVHSEAESVSRGWRMPAISTVAYWTAVLVVSLAFVVAIVIFLEARDLSSLSSD